MAFIDYYKILGIDKNTPQDKIKEAYKKRTKQFHPDLHPDDPKAKAKFQALNEAYDVLSDPKKRQKYDQFGEHWKDTSDGFGQGQYAHWGQGGQDFDFSAFEGLGGGGFSSFFEQIFGRGSKSRHQQYRTSSFGERYQDMMPQDTQATVNIDLYTALLGGEIIIQVAQQKLKLKIKPCTQQGAKVRIKGRGNALPNGKQSDLIITYNIKLPQTLSPRQQELLREMQHS